MKNVALIIVAIFVVVFLGPLIVLIGWNCARELWPQLPVATYHHAFWISNAIATLVKTHVHTKGD